MRQGYPACRLVAVFEPRTNTSRRRIFQAPYAAAFKDADLILVREPPDLWKVEPEEQFSSRQLVADLVQQGKTAFYYPTPTSSWPDCCRSSGPATWCWSCPTATSTTWCPASARRWGEIDDLGFDD